MERLAAGPHVAARTEAIWAVLRGELARAGRPVTAVDVGGGTGGFAVPLARDGHQVTVVDANPNSLAGLLRRAEEAGVASQVHAVQGDAGDLADLVPPQSADLVLCHSVLEIVDDAAKAVAAVRACLRPGGAASVVVANRAAAVLSRAVAGQFGSAAGLLADPDGSAGPSDRLLRRFDIAGASDLLTDAGLRVEQVHGVRVVADLVPGAVAEIEAAALLEFELAVAGVSPYRDIATQLHLLARKPG